MSQRARSDVRRLAALLTAERLTSYVAATDSLDAALALYDWNVDACASVLATVAMVEVVARNAMDASLTVWATRRGHGDWLNTVTLDVAGTRDLAEANRRASRLSTVPPHGKVIAELNFGFWRFMAANRYLTSIWMPALQQAFPHGPSDPLARQRAVDADLAQLLFARNRAAHHEPIHRRDLTRDHAAAIRISEMIDPVAASWVASRSTLIDVLAQKPSNPQDS